MTGFFHGLLRGPKSGLVSLVAACGMAGCVEPNYRNEVTADGQGHVKVAHVAKDPVRTPTVSAAPAANAASTSSESSSVAPAGATVDQRIDALEEQSRKLNEEITKLKLQKAAETK